MKKYNYKDLLNAYRYYLKFNNYNNKYDWYIRRFNALSEIFSIDFSQKIKSKDHLREILINSVKALNMPISPFTGYMEAPKYVTDLFEITMNDFDKAENAYYKAHFNMQCIIFKEIYGATEVVFNSAQLKEYGFDDSEPEPDLYDDF